MLVCDGYYRYSVSHEWGFCLFHVVVGFMGSLIWRVCGYFHCVVLCAVFLRVVLFGVFDLVYLLA